MNKKALAVLEYDKIINMLRDCAGSEMAKARIAMFRPSSDPYKIKERLAETTEAVAVITAKGALPVGQLYDIENALHFARKGGSLTMIATVLVETGSRMDDIIFEEFKGTGNAEIKLDRALSEARIFPAIDLAKSGTRHEELLLSPAECEGVAMVRRMLGQGHTREATAQLISMLLKTEKNEDFFKRLKEWLAIWEKEGYTIRSLRSGV